MSAPRVETELLVQAGRLLLEYNESTAEIHRALQSTAKALAGGTCQIAISYGGVAVSLPGDAPALQSVSELRYNTAVQVRVHGILDQVRGGKLDATTARTCIGKVEADTPRHARSLIVCVLGLGGASLARLLGADLPAAVVAGAATALGLLVRQELGRWRFSVLALPLTAAFIGAVLGGLAIRLGWTQSPELVVVVPALMVVPGPHLINGLFDLIDNYLPMSLSRLGLATGILLASSVGIILGIELTLPGPLFDERGANPNRLNLVSDVALAGIATCGFAMFYNMAWRHLGLAVAGGMAGHGVRFLALKIGWPQEVAAFLGGLAVGGVAAWMARSLKTPVAVIAFAGAVTMIPGLSLYRALGGAIQMARQSATTDSATVGVMLGNALQGCIVVSGLALGLILGTRAVLALTRERDAAVGLKSAANATKRQVENCHFE